MDATYLHVRTDTAAGGQVTSKAVVVATGVTADGRREILGVDVGDSEDWGCPLWGRCSGGRS